jgi:serine/threonine-protein kinase RsbW
MNGQLTVAGYFENLATIAEFIGRAAGQAGLDDKTTYALQMAVDEACTNIIEHAYGGEGPGSIQLTYEVRADGLEVIICDQGQAFDPSDVPELDTQAELADRQTRGMGLFFIYELVDQVEFEFGTAEGNRLTLFIRRKHLP